ncbi:MAG: NAD(P)H-dependent oxidoreductase subunit E [Omnitrophica WOR_2 bacterium]
MEQAVIQRDIKTIVKNSIEAHGASLEAIIPILSDVNRVYGYIPGEAINEVKRQLHQSDQEVYVSESQLFSIASFYHMFSTKPLGRHVVRFCESAPCHVMGGREVIKALKDELKLQPGETSPDKKWSLIMTSCLGVCGVGPVLLIDDDIYGNLKPGQIADILAGYE